MTERLLQLCNHVAKQQELPLLGPKLYARIWAALRSMQLDVITVNDTLFPHYVSKDHCYIPEQALLQALPFLGALHELKGARIGADMQVMITALRPLLQNEMNQESELELK
jgi:hypothetical protein